jgi:hypothetical protein
MPTDPIGEIPVEITGDYGPLDKALQAAMDLAKEWAGKIAEGFNSGLAGISEGANDFSEGLKEFIEHPLNAAAGALTGFIEQIGPLGVAATAAAGAFALIGKEVTDLVLDEGKAAEAMSNFALRLNVSFEDAKKLSEMAEVAGVSVDGLARVSMKLADALEQPAGAGKKVNDALQAMGVYASDSGEALLKLLQKLSEIPDATERIAKAHEIMGRSATQLEPLLIDYQKLGEAIDGLGGKLDANAIAKLKEADDAADKLGLAWAHLKEGLAAAFAPAVTAGLNLLVSLLTTAPADSLEKQIADLTMEVYDLSEAAKAGTPAVTGFFAAMGKGSGMQDTDGVTSGLIAQKQAALDMLEWQKKAFDQSKEYNDELDRSNMEQRRKAADAAAAAIKAQKEAAEAAKRHAAEVLKTNEAYRVLFLSFQGVDDKLQGIKAIKFEKMLYPDSWFKENKELLALFDKVTAAADKVAAKARFLQQVKLFPIDVKQIESLNDAWKILGQNGSAALNDNLTKSLNAYNAALQTALFTTHDLAVLENNMLATRLKMAEANAGTKDLITRLQLETKIAEVTGASAQNQIVALENIKLHTESLNIATHALGDVYVGLNESFLKVFDNLDKGLTKLITSGGSITDTLKSLGKSLEQDIVGTFVHGITEGLKKAFIDSGIGQAVSGFLTKVFGDVFGGLFKAATQAPGVVAQTANTTALTANTAALTALTSAMGAQGAASAAAGAAGGVPGAGGGASPTSGMGIGGTVNMITGAITAIASVLQYLQGRRMEKDIGRIEVTTRGMLNQLISLQGTLNDYLPELPHLVNIWAEIMVTNDILRLMAQNGVGVGSGGGSGSDSGANNGLTNPNFGQEIADVINNNPSKDDGGYGDLASSQAAQKQAVDDYTNALQTTASSAYSLDTAVTSATSSLQALNEITQQGALPALVKAEIVPAIADSISSNPQFMQGAMLPHVNNPIQYGSIAPVVGGPGVMRGGTQPTVSIYAVDPNGRQLANATQRGLEEIGIRTR